MNWYRQSSSIVLRPKSQNGLLSYKFMYGNDTKVINAKTKLQAINQFLKINNNKVNWQAVKIQVKMVFLKSDPTNPKKKVYVIQNGSIKQAWIKA